jgi:hypothetical protein
MKRTVCYAALAAAIGFIPIASAQTVKPAAPAADQFIPGTPIKVKNGAKVDNVHVALKAAYPAIAKVWELCAGQTAVITSGEDSFDAHKPFSWHFHDGRAIDLRGWHSAKQVACIKRELPPRLPKDFGGQGYYQLIWETPETHKTNAPHWHLAFVDPRGTGIYRTATQGK